MVTIQKHTLYAASFLTGRFPSPGHRKPYRMHVSIQHDQAER